MRRGKSTRFATIATAVGAAAFGTACFASGASASVVALSGTVRDAQGQVVAGAQVQLNAFAADKKGVHEVFIESVTSDASGHYTLPAPSTSQTAALAKIDAGTINYEVDVTSGSGGVIQTATTTAPASAVFSSDAQVRAAAQLPVTAGINLTVQPLQLASGAVARANTVRPNDCTNNYASWKTVSTGTYKVITGEPHDYIGMNVQYSYEQDASTTIGVALTADAGGSWSENGSASIHRV